MSIVFRIKHFRTSRESCSTCLDVNFDDLESQLGVVLGSFCREIEEAGCCAKPQGEDCIGLIGLFSVLFKRSLKNEVLSRVTRIK